MKVGIAFLADGDVKSRFAGRLATLAVTASQAGIDTTLINPETSDISQGRTIAAISLLDAGCSHLLFLDSDMVFPPDALTRLLQHDVDIAGATYSRRRPPFGLVHVELGGQPGGIATSERGLKEVMAVGTGCMLIKMSVIETIGPQFDSYWLPVGGRMSEDFDFCTRARSAGKRVFVDTDLSREVRHIGQHEFTLEDGQRLASAY